MSYASFRITALLLACAFAAATPGRGQSQELTLAQALAGVETANLSVLVSRESVSQAEENARIEQSSLLPLFSINVNQTRTKRGFSTNVTSGGAITNSFDAGLYGTLALIDLQQHANLRAARQAIITARRDFGTTVQSVMASIASLYFEHARNLAADTVIDANIERANVLLTLAKNQLDAGVATQIDVTRAEAALVAQQQAKLQQAVVITSSEHRLKRLLNLDLGTSLVLDTFNVKRDLEEAIAKLPLDAVLDRRA
jgi:outer membrane protein TolC